MERKMDVIVTIVTGVAVMASVGEVQLLLLWMQERKKCSCCFYHRRRKGRTVATVLTK